MLDAAHGEAGSSRIATLRVDTASVEAQTAGVAVPGCKRRCRPKVAIHSDTCQGSRREVAEARSRRKSNPLNEYRREVPSSRLMFITYWHHSDML